MIYASDGPSVGHMVVACTPFGGWGCKRAMAARSSLRSVVKSADTAPEAVKIPTWSTGGRMFVTSRSAALADIRTPSTEACASSKNNAMDREVRGVWGGAAAGGLDTAEGAAPPAGCDFRSEKNVISRGWLLSCTSKSAACKPPVRRPWRSRTVATSSTRLAFVEITRLGGNQAPARMRTSGGACARRSNDAQQIERSSRFGFGGTRARRGDPRHLDLRSSSLDGGAAKRAPLRFGGASRIQTMMRSSFTWPAEYTGWSCATTDRTMYPTY